MNLSLVLVLVTNVGNTGGSANATLVSHSHTVNNHTHSFSGSSSHSHTVNNHTHYTVQQGTRGTGNSGQAISQAVITL